MGYRIVLAADRSLMSEYRHIPLLDFLGCAPAEKMPRALFNFLAPPPPTIGGVAIKAPYGIRKLEAALLRGYRRDEVIVVSPDRVEEFINSDTRIFGIHTMDPLGIGPLSMMFTGGILTSYSAKYFSELVDRVKKIRETKDLKLKIIAGGQGTWQFEYRPRKICELGLDHVVIGEIDHIASDVFKQIEEDGSSIPELARFKEPPRIEDIPNIVGPTLHGMIEVMRGCGRNCDFCDANLRRARYIPPEKVVEEVSVNAKAGIGNVWTHSDDIFLYKLEDHKHFIPNTDAIVELFERIMSTPGVTHSNPTHGTIAPAASAPDLITKLSKILRAGPDNFIGIQTGAETGSNRLMKQFMPRKAKPFSPEEWSDILLEGTEIFNRNYWFPAYTLILGLPGETKDDSWDTLRLLVRMEKELPKRVGGRAHFTMTPMNFVPVGVLKGEEFFNNLALNEGQFCVIYRAWKHTLIEINRLPATIIKLDPVLKLTLNLLFKFGARMVLSYIKRLGRKMGFDPEKAINFSP